MQKYTYPKYQYLLFDARARAGVNTDDLPVLLSVEARPNNVPKKYGNDCIWYRVEKLNDNKVPTYGNGELMWEIE